jgi:hypothetical protein
MQNVLQIITERGLVSSKCHLFSAKCILYVVGAKTIVLDLTTV